MAKRSPETITKMKERALLEKLKREDRERRLKRWYIKGSWKPGTCVGDPMNWKSWRKFFVVPILFRSETDAWAYIDKHMFKNMLHLRKLSCSVETRWLIEETTQ